MQKAFKLYELSLPTLKRVKHLTDNRKTSFTIRKKAQNIRN